MKAERVLNINLGIIGHVDSGKTSLAKVLSGLPPPPSHASLLTFLFLFPSLVQIRARLHRLTSIRSRKSVALRSILDLA